MPPIPAALDRNGTPLRQDKRRIAETFGKAATTYDAAASLQQLVAARARLGLPELDLQASILDMGCGTGNETRALVERYPEADITGLDLSQGMLDFASQNPFLSNCHWAIGDIEELPFNEEQFDLVFSSLAIQWCECLSEVMAQVHRVLKPGGWFVFSTLAAGSLHELNAAWKSVDDKPHVNSYESLSRQKQRVASSDLSISSLRQQTETLYYPSVTHLFKEMKALGVNTVTETQQKGLAGKSTIRKLTEGYKPFVTEKGLPASYQVIYGVLRKPSAF
ncbi:malonyl-ACP O-methyltransferase BioC [Parendozoicomonas sp. Alg238-R29]|uniref:malonyl-ACP O-methyltransferase BioC n=1 Tax=Parendozoicomonas sp. Alg238-R29 TaxID=2993446 RepID=UPI00248D556E|nr:malonyl-ACP O-methyltransferase BioC [Parendozoicomonas sp. Alg238-R29]